MTFDEINPTEPVPITPIKQAVKEIVCSLQHDNGFRCGWQSNIAMSVLDVLPFEIPFDARHKMANVAADNFINLLINQVYDEWR